MKFKHNICTIGKPKINYPVLVRSCDQMHGIGAGGESNPIVVSRVLEAVRAGQNVKENRGIYDSVMLPFSHAHHSSQQPDSPRSSRVPDSP